MVESGTIEPTPIDPAATAATAALHRNLAALAGRHTLFGHQDALAYGHDWWAGDGRCDVREVAGAYPSVLGFDVGRLELGATANLDRVDFGDLRRWIRQGHALGSVITLSWHSVNPVTGGGYGENTSPAAISRVLPGGDHHPVLRDWLDRFAEFAGDLVDAQGDPIPFVFRPYHEHSGDWFWWGVGNDLNPAADFAALWRFTVDYLRETKGLHQLLWAISPDRSRLPIDDLATGYLAGYPGDDYVDILGIDNYWDAYHPANPTPPDAQFEHYVQTLEMVSQLATGRGKLAALTETAAADGHSRPWTGYLLAALKANPDTARMVWSLVWRNPVGEPGGAPHPGSPTAADFVAFYQDGFTSFQDTLPDLYSAPPATGVSRNSSSGRRGEGAAGRRL